MRSTKEYVSLSESPFIQRLKEDNFVICPNLILLEYRDVSDKAKFFYLYLLRYGLLSIINGYIDHEGNPEIFVKNETMAKEYGISRSTVTRYLNELTNAGLCKVMRRGQGKSSKITLYSPTNSEVEKESIEEDTIVEEPEQLEIDTKLTDLITDVMDSSIEVAKKKAEKRAQKRKYKKPVKNTHTLIKWFEEESVRRLKILPPLNGGKELSLVKRMIDHYGYETTQLMFDWAIANWAEFKKDKRLDGNINVSLIYGFRDYISEKLVEDIPKDNDSESDSAWL